MRKIKDVLRLHLNAGLSQEQIAAALGISKGVVAKCIALAATLGLSWKVILPFCKGVRSRNVMQPWLVSASV